MKVLTEIDNHYLTHTEDVLPVLELSVRGKDCRLRHARLGSDFVFGIWHNFLLAVPAKNISAIRGRIPDQIEELELADFLRLQKAPVRLELEVDNKKTSCWLLNITGNWLRISTRTGVEWVHLSAVVFAKVGPVNNPMH